MIQKLKNAIIAILAMIIFILIPSAHADTKTICYMYHRLIKADYVGQAGRSVAVNYVNDNMDNRMMQLIINDYKGDINGDGTVGLDDAIAALKVLAKITPSGVRSDYVTSGADVNGDCRAGSEEVLYILEVVSEIR